MITIEFTKGEVEALYGLVANLSLTGVDYGNAVSGVRKLRKVLENNQPETRPVNRNSRGGARGRNGRS